MDRPFPIQKLSFVALKHLIECLTPLEIYNFCQISKRIRNQIHSVIPKNKYKLELLFSYDIEIVFQCKGYSPYRPISYEFRSEYRNFHEMLDGFHIYSPMNEIGVHSMRIGVEMLCFVLKCKIDVLYIESKNCKWFIPSITDWLSSIQPSIIRCEFISQASSSPQILYLIQNLKVNKKFSIQAGCLYPYSHIRFDVNTLDPYQQFAILTSDIITSWNCIVFQLGEVDFSGEEMNKFIKSWIQGSNSRMRYLEFHIGCEHYPTIIEGIQVNERDKALKRSFEHPDLDCSSFDFEGGADIVNVNGKRATFQIQRDVIEEDDDDDWPYGWFQFAVWDD